MGFEPRFKISQKGQSGVEVLIVGYIFDSMGPKHYFQDHNHGRNFCRYLFSQTKAHPTNDLTRRNVISQLNENGKPVELPLDNPTGQYHEFMRKKFPAKDADKLLCDDGAYIGFAILTPEKHLISNFIFQSENGDPYIELGTFEMLSADQSDVDHVAEMTDRAQGVTFFEQQKKPDEHTFLADRIVQRLSSKHMGGEVLMTISHRDQLDHNTTYHIHRLLKRE